MKINCKNLFYSTIIKQTAKWNFVPIVMPPDSMSFDEYRNINPFSKNCLLTSKKRQISSLLPFKIHTINIDCYNKICYILYMTADDIHVSDWYSRNGMSHMKFQQLAPLFGKNMRCEYWGWIEPYMREKYGKTYYRSNEVFKDIIFSGCSSHLWNQCEGEWNSQDDFLFHSLNSFNNWVLNTQYTTITNHSINRYLNYIFTTIPFSACVYISQHKYEELHQYYVRKDSYYNNNALGALLHNILYLLQDMYPAANFPKIPNVYGDEIDILKKFFSNYLKILKIIKGNHYDKPTTEKQFRLKKYFAELNKYAA